MVLSDKSIKKLVEEKNLITPFKMKNLSSNSYDLTLDESNWDEPLVPGESRLIVTKETVNLPDNVVAKTVSKSSLARCGVSVGDIGGWVDAGFRGQLTLLAVNMGDATFDLSKMDAVCQIVFLESDDKAQKPYNGHYQDSKGLNEAYFKNKAEETIGFRNLNDASGVTSLLVDSDQFEKRCDF